MKKLILFISACLLAMAATAQQDSSTIREKTKTVKAKQPYRYCAKMKDGILLMMDGDNEMIMDVTLPNGTKIRTDASVTKPDGTVVFLEDGQCVDDVGNIFPDEPDIRFNTKEQERGKIPPEKGKK